MIDLDALDMGRREVGEVDALEICSVIAFVTYFFGTVQG